MGMDQNSEWVVGNSGSLCFSLRQSQVPGGAFSCHTNIPSTKGEKLNGIHTWRVVL